MIRRPEVLEKYTSPNSRKMEKILKIELTKLTSIAGNMYYC